MSEPLTRAAAPAATSRSRQRFQRAARRGLALAAVCAAGLTVSACEPAPWSAPAYPEAAMAARALPDGGIELWVGAECDGIAGVVVTLHDEQGLASAQWAIQAEDPDGGSFEFATVPGAVPGFEVDLPTYPTVPSDVTSWADAHNISVWIIGLDGNRVVTGSWSPERLAESAEHPDSYHNATVGWIHRDNFEDLQTRGPAGYYPFCELPEVETP